MDTRHKIAIITIALLMCCTGTNTEAKERLQRATEAFGKHSSFVASLVISINGEISQTNEQNATLYVYDNMFKLEMENQIIFSDSKSNYTYNTEAGELVIEHIDTSSPLHSPRSLFSLDLNLFDITNTEVTTTKRVYTLVSNDKIDGVKSIKITLVNNNISEVDLTDNTDNDIKIEVLSVNFDAKVNPDIFKFNKKDYKGVEVIDFR